MTELSDGVYPQAYLKQRFNGPVWLMQPIPYFNEPLEGEWVWEPKMDGWRLQILRYPDGHLEAWGRRLEKKPNWSARLLPLFKKGSENIPHGTLLDAELCAEGGRRFIPSVLAGKKEVRPLIFIFDVLYYDGEFWGNHTLRERKALLHKIALGPPLYPLAFFPLISVEKAYAQARQAGHEGIILKHLNSAYQIGQEAPLATPHWRKVK